MHGMVHLAPDLVISWQLLLAARYAVVMECWPLHLATTRTCNQPAIYRAYMSCDSAVVLPCCQLLSSCITLPVLKAAAALWSRHAPILPEAGVSASSSWPPSVLPLYHMNQRCSLSPTKQRTCRVAAQRGAVHQAPVRCLECGHSQQQGTHWHVASYAELAALAVYLLGPLVGGEQC